MRITANFEAWLLGDGSYPPFRNGMLVNLAFEMEPKRMAVTDVTTEQLIDLGNAQYSFVGKVLRVYREEEEEEEEEAIAAVTAGPLRFFIETAETTQLKDGRFIAGEGTLSVDYYMWVEFLDTRPDPPDLFFNLRVERIRKVEIPERFTKRKEENWVSFPTRVSPRDFEKVTAVESMADQDDAYSFYIVELEEIDEAVPRTFLGAA